MAEAFNPYHKWLGISPDEQPANHYRLLGLCDFESDPDAIDSSADRQMSHVQTHKTGPHSALSQKLLNELAAARLCLLDPVKKSAYDKALHAALAAMAPVAAAPPASAQPVYPVYSQAAFPAVSMAPATPVVPRLPATPQIAVGASSKHLHASRGRKSQRTLIQGLSIVATIVLLATAFYFVRSDGTSQQPIAQQPIAQQPPSAPASKDAGIKTPGVAAVSSSLRSSMPTNPPSALEAPVIDTTSVAASTASGSAQSIPIAANVASSGDAKISIPAESSTTTTQQPAAPAISTGASNRSGPLAPPTGDALAAAEQSVNESFQSEINAAKTPTEQHAAARRMFDRSFSPDLPADVSYVLLVRAAQVAAAAGRYDVACEAIDTMAGRFETDTVKLKSAALKAADRYAKSSSEFRKLADAWMDLASEATAADQYEAARESLDQAAIVARKTGDKTLIARAVEALKEATAILAAYDEAAHARDRLASQPGDPEAAAAWGRFLCLYKDDWDTGLAVWGRGLDKLAAVARQDLARPPFSTEQMALADRWWDAGDAATEEVSKKRLRLRAAYWYRYAKLGASRGDLVRIQERIDLTEQIATGFPIDQWVDLLKTVDLKQHVREGNWETNGNLLGTPGQGINYLMVPVTASGSYELEAMLTFGAKGRTEANFTFPVGSQNCMLILFGWEGKTSGLHQIDGKNANENESAVRNVGAVRGQRFKVLINVELAGEEAKISVDINSRKFIRWQGSAARLSVHQDVALPNSAFGVRSFRSPLIVNSLKLRVHSGVAKNLQ